MEASLSLTSGQLCFQQAACKAARAMPLFLLKHIICLSNEDNMSKTKLLQTCCLACAHVGLNRVSSLVAAVWEWAQVTEQNIELQVMDGELSLLLWAELSPWLGLTSAFHGKPCLSLPAWLCAWLCAWVMDGGLDVTQATKPCWCAPGHVALPAAVCGDSNSLLFPMAPEGHGQL